MPILAFFSRLPKFKESPTRERHNMWHFTRTNYHEMHKTNLTTAVGFDNVGNGFGVSVRSVWGILQAVLKAVQT